MAGATGHGLALMIRVAYPDLPEALGIEVRLRVGDWSASALVFTAPGPLGEAAGALGRWLAAPAGSFRLQTGSSTEQGGMLRLSWSGLEDPSMLACAVELQSPPESPRPASVRRLALELLTTPEAVARLARELETLVHTRAGTAGLTGF